MKKNILAALILSGAMVLSLTACGDNTAQSSAEQQQSSAADETSSAADSEQESSGEAAATGKASQIYNRIIEEVKFPSMADTTDRMTQYYAFDEAKVESYAGAICGSGAYPDEIGIFCLKSASDADALKTVLENRVKSVTEVFESYTPDEMYKIDGNNVIVSGNYVALIICSDNAKATEIFNTLAK